MPKRKPRTFFGTCFIAPAGFAGMISTPSRELLVAVKFRAIWLRSQPCLDGSRVDALQSTGFALLGILPGSRELGHDGRRQIGGVGNIAALSGGACSQLSSFCHFRLASRRFRPARLWPERQDRSRAYWQARRGGIKRCRTSGGALVRDKYPRASQGGLGRSRQDFAVREARRIHQCGAGVRPIWRR